MNSLAHPYANAVFDLAKSSNNLNSWKNYLLVLAEVANTEEFSLLINNPKFSNEEIISSLLGFVKDPNKELENFLRLLQSNNRLSILPEIFILFDKLVEDEENTARAVIQSAFAMNDQDKQQFEELLSKKFGRKILAEVKVDPELIGGVKILINDTVIDASVKGSLEKMAAQIIK